MSEWSCVEIEFNDENTLIETLERMGYSPKVHNTAQSILGYGSHASQKAHIVIGKSQFGGYTDCGFERFNNGQFKIHIDEMDHNKFKVNKLKQYYAETKILKTVEKRSKYSIKNREETNGKIHIRLKTNF